MFLCGKLTESKPAFQASLALIPPRKAAAELKAFQSGPAGPDIASHAFPTNS